MGAMMALRTALAYFLSKEIKELEEEEEVVGSQQGLDHLQQHRKDGVRVEMLRLSMKWREKMYVQQLEVDVKVEEKLLKKLISAFFPFGCCM